LAKLPQAVDEPMKQWYYAMCVDFGFDKSVTRRNSESAGCITLSPAKVASVSLTVLKPVSAYEGLLLIMIHTSQATSIGFS
jgi:hypothetical protein